MTDDIKPFKIHISDEDIELTRRKLELARLPKELSISEEEKWSYGAPGKDIQDLVEYWKNGFDWRAQEEILNTELPQFTTPIDTEEDGFGTLNIHFVWKKSTRKNAMPLIFIHGWPGSFIEVKKLLSPLTEPSDPSHPAFDVVAPSLPGFSFSDGPKKPGLSVLATGRIFNKLMKKLGYDHYVVQGGDWGGLVARGIALQFQEACRGIHVNFLIIPPSPLVFPFKFAKLVFSVIFNGYLPGGYSKKEIDRIKYIRENQTALFGYFNIQTTKPQTLSYGLVDSPVGILGWIYEKLIIWTDKYPWTPDELLTWIGLYWYTDTASTLRYYKEFARDSDKVYYGWSNVPLGYTQFPGELLNFPDDSGHAVQPMKFFKARDVGGHFAAWERPQELLEDVREFYGKLQLEDPKLQKK